MARIRSVKPEYWTSEQVMNMSRDARLLFIGLWTFCDDNGIHPASALSLKAEVLPGDTLTADQVMVFIDEMIEQGLVEEYDVDGRAFWRVTGWRRHQRIDQPTFRHPTGDARGDTGDAGDAGDTKGDRVTGVTYKRLGGKQRQIVLRKLRERDGDACHLCGDTSNLSILSLAANGDENANDINSLRLICSGCKRGRKRGDTRNLGGDTKGDAQSLGGDSTTERSGVERSREDLEGNKNQPPVSSAQASTEVGDAGDTDQGDSLRPALPTARNAQIALLLRAQGVQTTSQNPIVAVTWAQDSKVTDEVLNVAIAKAKQAKPGEAIPVKYLERVVSTMLAELAAPPPSPAAPRGEPDWAWKKSTAATDAKGRELRMFARNGESYDDFRVRIQAELDKRKGRAA